MKTKILLALAVVFVSGLVIGFFSGQWFAERRIRQFINGGPAPFEQMLVSRLCEILGLNKDQIPAVRKEVSVVVQEFERDRREHGEVIRARMTELMKSVRPLLNDAQQGILDKMDVEDLRPGPPLPRPPSMNANDFSRGPRPDRPPEGADGLRPPPVPPPDEPGPDHHSAKPPDQPGNEAEPSQ